MKIREKLLSLPSIVLVMMTILGGVAIFSMSNMRHTLKDIYEVNLQNQEISNDILTDATRANIAVYRLFTWLNNLDEKAVKKNSDEISTLLESAINKTNSLKSRPGFNANDREKMDEIAKNLKSYESQIVQSIDYAQIDPNMGLAGMRTADESFLKINKQIVDLVDKAHQTSKSSYEAGIGESKKVTTGFIGLLVIAIILSISLSLVIGGKIVASVKAAIETAQRIAKGDLTGFIEVHSDDEIGELLAALNNMRSNLQVLVQQIVQTSELLIKVTQEINNSSKSIIYGTGQQNIAAATMASAIEQMTQGIGVINSHARDADTSMKGSKQLSEEEQSILKKVKESMTKIEDAAVGNSSVVQSLGQESERISDIINVIRSIADQTNLLALNAAIEAARAGEQGRGFAVVADEVRSLAARTATSTQEITAMIDAIQKQVAAAVNGMANSLSFVESGGELTQQAQETVLRSVAQITEVANMVSEISRALHEQRSASEVIAKEVHHIAEMAEQNNSAAANTAHSLEALNSLSGDLQASVRRFRI